MARATANQQIAAGLLIMTMLSSSAMAQRFGHPGNATMPSDMNKTVWMLWFQGWNSSVPWLIQKAALSWRLYNPGWRIILLDRENLKHYLPDIKLHPAMIHQAESDMVRMALMAKYGGVWADATMLCMEPLDRWVPIAMKDSKHWMYGCNGPASWFMMSTPGSYVAKEWLRRAEEYWGNEPTNTTNPRGYNWMDSLFFDGLNQVPEFKKEWDNVPKECCKEAPNNQSWGVSPTGEEWECMASSLGKKGMRESAPDLQDRLWLNPPHAIKMSRHSQGNVHGCPDPDTKKANGFQAIKAAMTRLQLYGVDYSLVKALSPELFCEEGESVNFAPGEAGDYLNVSTVPIHHHQRAH